MTTDSYSVRIGEVLRDQFGARRHATKLIARLAEATDRAARNWLEGACGPQAASLIMLMAREPAVARAVQELVDEQRRLDGLRQGGAPAPGREPA